MMNLAVTQKTYVDFSNQCISEDMIPDLREKQSIRMVAASGAMQPLLAHMASDCHQIVALNISACDVAVLDLNTLAGVVSKESLVWFEAENLKPLTSQDMTALLSALNRDCQLLNLGNPVFTDDPQALPCLSALASFEQLESLSLKEWYPVGDVDLMALPRSLKYLDISGIPLASFGFLSRLPDVEELDLDGGPLSLAAQASLVAVLSDRTAVRVRIGMSRLPQERAVSEANMAKLAHVAFY